MSAILQVNDCRLVFSSVPNAVNELPAHVGRLLPREVRPLIVQFYTWLCKTPHQHPMKFMVMDMENGREDLFERIGDSALHTADAVTRRAGLWWDLQTVDTKNRATLHVLNAFGCMYAWCVHRTLPCHEWNERGIAPQWPINMKTLDGMTVLHLAAMFGRDALVAHLLAHGADVRIPDHEGRTPLHWVASDAPQPSYAACAAQMLAAGADANATDVYGRTPLHAAINGMSAPMIRLLLNNDADPDRFDREGVRPRDLISKFKPEAIIDPVRAAMAEFDAHQLNRRLAVVPQPPRNRL